jgi:hypothetical protein
MYKKSTRNFHLQIPLTYYLPKLVFSKIVKIRYILYVHGRKDPMQLSYSILSKIDGTSAYIAISTQVIHLLEDMNP